jgi:threonine/homoserine/homoserine lactone efflux protein
MVLAVVAVAAGALRDQLAASVRLRSASGLIAATVFGALGLRLIFESDR